MTWIKNIKDRVWGKPHPKGLVLMYHRIREEGTDPWDICVSEARFQQQLLILGNSYEVLPVSEMEHVLQQEEDTKKILITFDDGYRDNYDVAVPLLRKAGFPATFFIPTQILTNDNNVFWWEMVDRIFWNGYELPEKIELICGENLFQRSLTPAMQARNPGIENNWSANTMPPPSVRCRFYLELCAWIKERGPEEQQSIVGQLISQIHGLAGNDAGIEKMRPENIRHLAGEGFGIGAHTVHHPALAFQSPEVRREEILLSKAQLEKLTGKPVATFAYPHGNYNETTTALVREAGFTSAFTTEAGALKEGSDPFVLPRMWVKNIDAQVFKRQLDDFFHL